MPTEAAQLGISDFFRLVADVSQGLNSQFSKVLDLQATIKKVAIANNKQLSEVQMGGFALAGERLGLSRAFVAEQWVPRLLAQIPDEVVEENTADTSAPPPLPPAETPLPPGGSGTLAGAEEATPLTGETAATMQQKVRDILDDYHEHIPAQAIRALFRAISYDEKALAEAVLTYLTTNYYAAETEPVGGSLRQKLASTDWRHLAWWDQKPTPPANVPVSQPVSPPTPPPVVPVAASSSGWRDMGVALLVAGGLLGFVFLLLRGNRADQKKPPRPATEVVTNAPTRQPGRKKSPKKTGKSPGPIVQPMPTTPPPAEADQPVPVREEPYDELGEDVGQYGERPAQKDGHWGLWRKNRWLILPEYDQIEVYSEGRAKVSINGNSYYLDRYGDRIR